MVGYIVFADSKRRAVKDSSADGCGCVGWTGILGSEAVFFCILVDFWAEGAVPQAALCKYFSSSR